MRDIREKMCYKVPNGLFWLDIFLSTGRAIPARSFSSAVKTYLFRSLSCCVTPVILIKNKDTGNN